MLTQQDIVIETEEEDFLHYNDLQYNNSYDLDLLCLAEQTTYSESDQEISVDSAPIVAGMAIDLTMQNYSFCWDNIPGGMASPINYYTQTVTYDGVGHTITAASSDVYQTSQRFDPNMVNILLVNS